MGSLLSRSAGRAIDSQTQAPICLSSTPRHDEKDEIQDLTPSPELCESEVTATADSVFGESEASDDPPAKKLRSNARKEKQKKGSAQRVNRRRKRAEPDLSDKYKVVDMGLECELCDKLFESQAQLICHKPCFYKRKGMTEEPVQWTCSECHKFFNRLSVLSQHMSIHFDGKYMCNKCHYRVHRRKAMVEHIMQQHAPDPQSARIANK